jgi:hypothetical protein
MSASSFSACWRFSPLVEMPVGAKEQRAAVAMAKPFGRDRRIHSSECHQ